MKKPDRFDRLSESVCEEYRTGQCLIRDILKKKFKAQHAAYVRLVKGRRPVTKDKNPLTPYGEAYQMLCDDLLAEFERYRKGKS